MKKNDLDKHHLVMSKAQELFAEQGYLGTTISQIAKACGISEGSIYGYFTNKEDLLFSIAEYHFEEFCQEIKRHLLGVNGAKNRLSKFVWHYLMSMEEKEQFTRLFIKELWSNQRFYAHPRGRPIWNYWRILEEILEDGIKSCEFREDLDITLCQHMVAGTMNHLMLSRVMLGKPLKLLDKGDALVSMFLHAFERQAGSDELIWGVSGRKAEILQAALEEFVVWGYERATVARICARAGITEPTLYEYFSSKEDIMLSIPECAIDKFLKNFRGSLGEPSMAENRFRLFLWSQIRSYDRYPEYYKILMGDIRCNPKFYGSQAYRAIREYVGELSRILEEGVANGEFRKDLNINLMIHLYFGMLDQYLLSARCGSNKTKLGEKLDDIFELLLRVAKGPSSYVS